MITISEAAQNEIKRIQTTRQQQNSYLRLTVKAGGCADFYYIIDWDQTINHSDRIYPQQNFSVVIDEASLPYLNQLTLDYTEDLMGGGFRFKNPQATYTCSCSISFSIG